MTSRPTHGLRTARLGLVAAAIVVGAVLVSSALLNYGAVKQSTEELIAGQAAVLLDGLQAYLREEGLPPTADSLDAWFELERDSGVTFASLGGDERLRVGVAATGTLPAIADDEALSVRRVDGRIRAERKRGRVRRPGRKARARGGDRAALSQLVIEFVPLTANKLVARAKRQLLLSLAIALGLIGFAGAAYRWLARRERLDRAQAERAHLAHLGEMSAVIAHELRNPLASLKGHAELLTETVADERAKAKAERVLGEARRIERLTSELLAFAKTGKVSAQPLDPAALARDAAARVNPERITLELGTAPPSWLLDSGAIGQVLINLLQNAIEASPPEAKVTLAASEHKGALIYTVRDRGGGIEAARLGDLFEPFVTTRTQGTGLGLAVALRLVTAHGGTITASNHEGGGALFMVSLPRTPAQGASSQ